MRQLNLKECSGTTAYKQYKQFLYILLIIGVLMTVFSVYYAMWNTIPSTIMVKAGVNQTLDFNIPASGKLYREAVETSGQKNHRAFKLILELRLPLRQIKLMSINYKSSCLILYR